MSSPKLPSFREKQSLSFKVGTLAEQGDLRVKAVISFVQKYIPGNPNIKEYKKLTGDEATPLMPDEMDKAIKGLPRDREIVELFKKISGAGPLPAR